jgi:hypothetical protein
MKFLDVGAGDADVLVAAAVVDDEVFVDDDGAAGVDHAGFAVVFVPFVGLEERGVGAVEDLGGVLRSRSMAPSLYLPGSRLSLAW